jgi:hypothetical protein
LPELYFSRAAHHNFEEQQSLKCFISTTRDSLMLRFCMFNTLPSSFAMSAAAGITLSRLPAGWREPTRSR